MTDILDLEGWNVIDKTVEGGEYLIEAEYAVPPTACTKCGVINHWYNWGPKPITIRDSPIRGRPVRIIAKAKRYKCRACNGTFIQPLGGLHPDTRMTARCVEFIEEQCLRDTFIRIAEHVGCDDRTVRDIAHAHIDRLNASYRPWLPEWLGIDETMIDGKQRCVITDVVNRVPIDMLPDRDLPTVTQWLYQFRERNVVKGLAIDMWRPYKTAAHAVFPGLPVIIDKFHLVRMANTAMDNVRISMAKDQAKVVGRDWMRRKVLLRLRYKNLDVDGRYNLDMWLDNEPELAIAYRLKESFYDIYDSASNEDAAKRLDDWRASVPAGMRKTKKDFKPLMTCTANWREEMLAYFDHPISNGYTEALNGVAKVINRAGRGYSFKVLRARLLFRKQQRQQECDMSQMVALPIDDRTAMLRYFISMEHENTCVSCGGKFPDEDMAAHIMPAIIKGEHRIKGALLCATCNRRFHTEVASHHDSASTP